MKIPTIWNIEHFVPNQSQKNSSMVTWSRWNKRRQKFSGEIIKKHSIYVLRFYYDSSTICVLNVHIIKSKKQFHCTVEILLLFLISQPFFSLQFDKLLIYN